MKLLAHLRSAGWFELTRPYPDQGSLYDVDWYNAPLRIGTGAAGAIISANAEGLRLVVGSGLSALFVPWSEVTVSGWRGWIDTVIRLQTRAVPSLPLVLHLEDAEADALLGPAGLTLPARRWPWGPWLCVVAVSGVLVALLGAALLVANR